MTIKYNFSVRHGNIDDSTDFSKLITTSGELLTQLWGNHSADLMKTLFRFPDNIYGYHHSFFACYDEHTVGFFLGGSGKTIVQEQAATQRRIINFLGWHYCKRFFKLRQINNSLGDLQENEFFLSNIAVYEKFRNLGAGTFLLNKVFHEAGFEQCTRIVLDVLSTNAIAIRFYEKNGFRIEKIRPAIHLDGRDFQFYKMVFKLDS